jgi:hypothetical protein
VTCETNDKTDSEIKMASGDANKFVGEKGFSRDDFKPKGNGTIPQGQRSHVLNVHRRPSRISNN